MMLTEVSEEPFSWQIGRGFGSSLISLAALEPKSSLQTGTWIAPWLTHLWSDYSVRTHHNLKDLSGL